jgi:hypothetical protein
MVGLFRKKTSPTTAALPIRIPDYSDSLEGRAEAATAALATLARAGDAGRPFGPGFGLEQAREWLLQILPNQSELQAVGHVAGDTLIAGFRSKRIDFDSIDRVLGIDQEGVRKFSLSRRQEAANIRAIEGAKETLVAMTGDDLLALRKWHGDARFMAEVLAYHQLAVLRLRLTGDLGR